MQRAQKTMFPTMLKINKESSWIKIKKILSGAFMLIAFIVVVSLLMYLIQGIPSK